MATTDRKRSIIVGLFTFIGLIILVAGILVLGTQQNKFSKNLTVTTYFKDVKGLKVGNNVWFSGVKVGIIKEISFESVENVKVVLNVEEKSSQFIRKDVIATLSSDGLIGNAIISLVGGSEAFPQIEDNDVIKSGVSGGMDAMLATLQVNNENLLEITKNFALLSKQILDGKGTVGALMTDDEIANNLKKTVVSLNGTMTTANAAVNNLLTLSQKLNNNEGLIHDLTTDKEVFASLRQSAAQLQGVTQTASALMANLNETTARLNDKDNAIGVLTNDPEAANEIKQILRNLNMGSAKLDENMEALQSNFLLRGFFKKKAKEEAEAGVDSLKN
ncbi:MlaD family protein [Sphingobacterium sp. CZ-2]|uniref:MlaD family protein n=1 Tax=Sphingobacterium sp. CZ-2 TaxID=2557994 RepID=UPI00106F8098|nr:MlaD family protein [Sphingobacterium sp. CZ-2]QBR12608.1 MCE family protein [Sphingobacterium sp. CZ-2]